MLQPNSLRGEIGILRLLVEARMNECKTDADLVAHCQAIAALILCIERLVVEETKFVKQAANEKKERTRRVRGRKTKTAK